MAALNIRNIGAERKASLEEEAKRRSVSVADLVRELLDIGLEKAERERAKAEWVAAAKPALADERALMERDGPLLPEYRDV